MFAQTYECLNLRRQRCRRKDTVGPPLCCGNACAFDLRQQSAGCTTRLVSNLVSSAIHQSITSSPAARSSGALCRGRNLRRVGRLLPPSPRLEDGRGYGSTGPASSSDFAATGLGQLALPQVARSGRASRGFPEDDAISQMRAAVVPPLCRETMAAWFSPQAFNGGGAAASASRAR